MLYKDRNFPQTVLHIQSTQETRFHHDNLISINSTLNSWLKQFYILFNFLIAGFHLINLSAFIIYFIIGVHYGIVIFRSFRFFSVLDELVLL